MTFAKWLVYVATAGQLAFVLLYGVGSWNTWRREPIGRALMTKSVGLAMILALTSARYLFGDYPYRAQALMICFGIVVVGIYWQLIVFTRIRWRRSHSKDEDAPADSTV